MIKVLLQSETEVKNNNRIGLQDNIRDYVQNDFAGQQLVSHFKMVGTAEYDDIFWKNKAILNEIARRGEIVMMIYVSNVKPEWIITNRFVYSTQNRIPLIDLNSVQEFKLERGMLNFRMEDGWKGCVLTDYENKQVSSKSGLVLKLRDIALVRIINCIIANQKSLDKIVYLKREHSDVTLYNKRCVICGVINKATSRYCFNCGNNKFKTICFRCGKENDGDNVFCPNCRLRLINVNKEVEKKAD